MPIDYDTPLYPIRQAAMAAGFELNTLRSLYQRGRFRVVGGEEAKARGLGHVLNLRDILTVAVAKRLMDAGAEPAAAFMAGVRFVHVGSGGSIRLPGEVHKNGFTVMVFFPSTGSDRIVSLKSSLPFAELFINPDTGKRDTPVVLLLNDVERDVFMALRIGARAE